MWARVIEMSERKKVIFSFLFLLLVTGCASLPRVDDLVENASFHPVAPTIIGAQGRLLPEESEAVLKQMEQQVEPTNILEQNLPLVESVAGSALYTGNKVTLLIDGDVTYAAMLNAIRNARDHVNLETYILSDDDLGRRLIDLLLEKQAEGVQVNLIYDSFGCLDTPGIFFQRLKQSGIQTLQFDPINPLKVRGGWELIHRDHRKILIVDGKMVFTGGINISRSEDQLDIDPLGKNQLPWRDTDVLIEGPVVAEFQKMFLNTWVSQNGSPLSQRDYFPPLEEKGRDLVSGVGSTPGRRNTFLLYALAIMAAKKSIYLTNSYFAPDRQLIKALTDAGKRGVDVRVILPAKSDIQWFLNATRSYYTGLLKSDVKVYERQDAVLHAKTVVIDHVWATVGSTNLEFWSLLRNDEVNAIILGRDFAKEMEARFKKDLDLSDQILLDKWRNRPLIRKLKEWFFGLFTYWL